MCVCGREWGTVGDGGGRGAPVGCIPSGLLVYILEGTVHPKRVLVYILDGRSGDLRRAMGGGSGASLGLDKNISNDFSLPMIMRECGKT